MSGNTNTYSNGNKAVSVSELRQNPYMSQVENNGSNGNDEKVQT